MVVEPREVKTVSNKTVSVEMLTCAVGSSKIFSLLQDEIKTILTKAQSGEIKLTENKQTLLCDLLETETFPDFETLLQKTPSGV